MNNYFFKKCKRCEDLLKLLQTGDYYKCDITHLKNVGECVCVCVCVCVKLHTVTYENIPGVDDKERKEGNITETLSSVCPRAVLRLLGRSVLITFTHTYAHTRRHTHSHTHRWAALDQFLSPAHLYTHMHVTVLSVNYVLPSSNSLSDTQTDRQADRQAEKKHTEEDSSPLHHPELCLL